MLLARYTNWNRPCSELWRRLRLQRVKMRNDAINMEVNEGLLAFGAEEEGAVGVGVNEEVFGEDGGGGGVAEDVEVGFEVGVGVGVVGAEALAGEVGLGGGVEGGGDEAVPGVFPEHPVGRTLARRQWKAHSTKYFRPPETSAPREGRNLPWHLECRGFLHNKSSSIRLNHPLNNVVFGSKFWNLSRIFRIFEP